MRIASHVLLSYVLLVVFGSAWRLVPLGPAAPDLVALVAVYLGLTARHRLAPATLGAVVLGYLGDLLSGMPRGMLALIAGIVCILGHVTHRRLIVRGLGVTAAVSFFTGVVSGLLGLLVRVWAGVTAGDMSADLVLIVQGALFTAALGPLMFRLCRWVDWRFARTLREREATLEGLAP